MSLHYTIYTENKNPEGVVAILNQYFDGYTVLRGMGYWKGKPESSLIVLIVEDNAEKVQRAAEDIKSLNEQEAILIVETQCAVTFV